VAAHSALFLALNWCLATCWAGVNVPLRDLFRLRLNFWHTPRESGYLLFLGLSIPFLWLTSLRTRDTQTPLGVWVSLVLRLVNPISVVEPTLIMIGMIFWLGHFESNYEEEENCIAQHFAHHINCYSGVLLLSHEVESHQENQRKVKTKSKIPMVILINTKM